LFFCDVVRSSLTSIFLLISLLIDGVSSFYLLVSGTYISQSCYYADVACLFFIRFVNEIDQYFELLIRTHIATDYWVVCDFEPHYSEICELKEFWYFKGSQIVRVRLPTEIQLIG
jgi:hypothetical protein